MEFAVRPGRAFHWQRMFGGVWWKQINSSWANSIGRDRILLEEERLFEKLDTGLLLETL